MPPDHTEPLGTPNKEPTETLIAEAKTVEELVAASAELAASRTGAIIVIERGSPLDDVISNGVPIDNRFALRLLRPGVVTFAVTDSPDRSTIRIATGG